MTLTEKLNKHFSNENIREELLFEQVDSIHTNASIHGYKLETTMGTKKKNYLFININGKKIQLTIGDKAFKQIVDATKHSNTLEQ